MSAIVASFVSACPECEMKIGIGERIVHDDFDGRWVHECCPTDEPFVSCPTCFISPCECED